MVYIGTADAGRNAGFALNAATGVMVWAFWGGAKPGLVVTDVNGVTYNAGDTWTTKVSPNDTPNTPWRHRA